MVDALPSRTHPHAVCIVCTSVCTESPNRNLVRTSDVDIAAFGNRSATCERDGMRDKSCHANVGSLGVGGHDNEAKSWTDFAVYSAELTVGDVARRESKLGSVSLHAFSSFHPSCTNS